MKRAFDLAVAASALVLTSPIMLAAALAVKVSSPGPVFFSQERIGLGGEPFRIHKFRTMRHDASGPAVSSRCDPRVTKLGLILRQSKIDELPQLFDVIRGRMSLVGPRPEVPEYVAEWPSRLRPLILSVKPGITDPASIRYRNEADELATADDAETYYKDVILPDKALFYAEYASNHTVIGDLHLLLLTAKVVLLKGSHSSGRG